MSDAIRVQVELQVKKPAGVELTVPLVRAILDRWIETGKLVKGFKVEAIHWSKAGSYRMQRHARTQREINQVARGLLQQVPFTFSEIRYR